MLPQSVARIAKETACANTIFKVKTKAIL